MVPTLSKREIKAQVKELRNRIADSEGAIKGEFRPFGKAANAYAKVTKEYEKAQAAYEKKPKAKNERKRDAVLDSFYEAHDIYKASRRVITAHLESMDQDYNELCELLEMSGNSRKADKATIEFEQYKEWLENKLAKMSNGVRELANDEDDQPAEETEEIDENNLIFEEMDAEMPEEEETPVAAPAPVVPQVAVSPVSINPVILDLSSVVENTVNNVLDKLALQMEKKLAAYVEGLELPATGATTVVKEVVKEIAVPVAAPATPAPATTEPAVSAEAVELQGEIAGKQQEIYNKLKALSEEVNAMLEALEATSGKQKDLNAMQKQTNDSLRRIMRDQQGIQVSLRVVSQDQAEVNAQQAAVVESQKLVVEQQQALADAQNGMIETQNAVITTQSGLNDAMKAVMQAQKEILHTQNRIAQGNAKAQEAGKVLLEKQEELTELQKAALANQRQAAKDFKDATTTRQRKPKEEAPAEAAE